MASLPPTATSPAASLSSAPADAPAPATTSPAVPPPTPTRINVVNGDLSFARYPVVVGHAAAAGETGTQAPAVTAFSPAAQPA